MPINANVINPENSDFPVRIFLTTKKPPREEVALNNLFVLLIFLNLFLSIYSLSNQS